MDKYSIFIVAKYFKTKSDYVTLVTVCKKYKDILAFFRYNPIGDASLFPLMKTQYFYRRDDLKYRKEGMIKYIHCYNADQDDWMARKDNDVFRSVTLQNYGASVSKILGKIDTLDDSFSFSDKDVDEILDDKEDKERQDSEKSETNGKVIPDDYVYTENVDVWNCPLPVINGSVTVPEGITSLGPYCFAGCTGVTNIKLPSTLREINDNAFENTSISSITIPEGVTSLGDSCFAECFHLVHIDFPRTLKEIGSWCVFLSGAIESVTIPRDCKIGTDGLNDVEVINYY